MNIERILCPTDLTSDAEDALRYALALSRAYDAELILLHCETRSDLPANDESKVSLQKAELLQAAFFQRVDPAELSGLRWQPVVVSGDDVGEAITHAAEAASIDLIVMRSRRRPHRAALLGSTAESVCRTAPCPVLVMHSDERDWVAPGTARVDLKRVLVAYDFSDYSERALNYGLSFAQEYQAELHLLHVLPRFSLEEPEISWYPLGKEGAYHKTARRLQKAVPAEAHLWCDIKNAVSEGQAYREILDYAERNAIDLICIGAHGAGFGSRTLFGSNVDRVLRQAPCPVLVARSLKHLVSKRTKSVAAELDHMKLSRKPVTRIDRVMPGL